MILLLLARTRCFRGEKFIETCTLLLIDCLTLQNLDNEKFD